MTLREKFKQARDKLRKYMKLRHQATPGSNPREHYGKLVRFYKGRKAKLLAKLNSQPDFNGCDPNVNQATKDFIVRANRARLYVTSTRDGGHAATSWHYVGRAADVAGLLSDMIAFQRAEAATYRTRHLELFGPDNTKFVKNGALYAIAEGDPLENQHDNHVHGAQ